MRLFLQPAICGLLIVFQLLGQSEERYTVNERILRIRELGKKNAAVLPILAQYLSEPSSDIRLEAVKSIVRIGTDASLEPLMQATRDKNEDVQIRAIDGLVNFYVPGYVARSGLTGSMTRGARQVKSLFSTRNDQVIDPSITIRPEIAAALTDVLQHGAGLSARANAALACGILRNKAAVPALVQALHSKDDDTIFESLVALQKIQDLSAGPGVSFVAGDLDERVQTTALETIAVLRSSSSAPEVRSALSRARNNRVRRAALKALAVVGTPADRATFRKYTDDRDVELRSAALEGLGRIREPEDFPTLQQAFDQGEIDWRIHLAAAFAMVKQGKLDTSEFSPLAYILESLGNKGRSDTAVAYLAELLADDKVLTAFSGITREMDKTQKIGFCSALGAVRTPQAIDTLHTLAKDIDPDVVAAASKALRTAQTRQLPS